MGLTKTLRRTRRSLSHFWRYGVKAQLRNLRRYWTDPMYPHYRRWLRDGVNDTLRFSYPLSEKSIVFDVGGFEGGWAAAMFERYGCRIFVFEPVPDYHKAIIERFRGNHQIQVYDFGLAAKDETVSFSVLGDASSSFKGGDERIEARMRDICAFLEEENIEHVDLIKINIEGGEFELLERMIDSGTITTFENLQVQFHTFVDNSVMWRKSIVKRIEVTHAKAWSYPFVWEGWIRRAG